MRLARASQTRAAIENGFLEVAVGPSELGARPGKGEPDVAPIAAKVFSGVADGRSVIVHSCFGPDDSRLRGARTEATAEPREVVGRGLATIAQAVAHRSGLTRFVIAGGDTSSRVGAMLGIDALQVATLAAPGAPICRVSSWGLDAGLDGLEIVFKGRQTGSKDFYVMLRVGANIG